MLSVLGGKTQIEGLIEICVICVCVILLKSAESAFMYTIIVYDVNQSRVNKVCKFLRRYLDWVQNSVFEGEIGVGKLAEIKSGLKRLINADEDSIIFYTLGSNKWLKRDILGQEFNPRNTVL